MKCIYYGFTSFVLSRDNEGLNKYSYLPVQRIASRCCFGNMHIELSAGIEDVIVVIPIPFKFRTYILFCLFLSLPRIELASLLIELQLNPLQDFHIYL